MKAGEIYWVEFPTGGGRAQSGRRPAIILQTVTTLPTTLLVPLTSQIDALRFPGTTLIEPDQQNGLPRPSVALVFQLTAVDNWFITQTLGVASDEAVKEILSALDTLTGRT
jgi:mRNA-degrading endonuclease toxin of MazEF toxin-antitoxin module